MNGIVVTGSDGKTLIIDLATNDETSARQAIDRCLRKWNITHFELVVKSDGINPG